MMGSRNGSILLCLFVVVLSQYGVLGDGPLECTYKHTHYTTVKYHFRKDPRAKDQIESESKANVDFIFKLSCKNSIATVTYDNHILDKFKVGSCNENQITGKIFVEKQPDPTTLKDDRNLPIEVKIYCVNGAGECYEREYNFKNWLLKNDILRDAGEITRYQPSEHELCERDTSLQVFGNCKLGTSVSYNVHHIEYVAKVGEQDWFPSSLLLYPSDENVPHTKLLACSYQTGKFVFRLLCIKKHGENGAAAYVGEEDPQSVFMDRFSVASCQEDHIVNSIFPPNYSNGLQPGAGTTHVIKYGYFRETCMQRHYKCPFTGRAEKDSQPSKIVCPSDNDASVGRWTNCEGPLKSPPLIDLTTA